MVPSNLLMTSNSLMMQTNNMMHALILLAVPSSNPFWSFIFYFLSCLIFIFLTSDRWIRPLEGVVSYQF